MSLLLRIQPDHNSLMLAEDDNTSDYFIYHNKEEYPLGNEGKDVEEDQRDSVGKSSDNKSVRNILLDRIPQDGLLVSESSSFLREVWFDKQKYLAATLVSDINYNQLKPQNNNTFYPFNNRLDYALAHYFADSDTTKGNVDRFLFDPFMAPLIKKIFYQNFDK